MLTQHNGKQWFFEELYTDNTFGFEVSTVLVPEYDTCFQKLMVLDTPRFGKVLILDNIVQFTELDEYIYHESMAHTALCSHTDPKKVLIIGGGDGCIAREVLKHKCVESVTIIDIDPEVTKVVQEHFDNINQTTFSDPRLTILHEDATKVDARFTPESFDVILMDTTDNISNATPLFQGQFTEKMHSLLRASGICIRLGGSHYLQRDEIEILTKDMGTAFEINNVRKIVFSAPATYYGGPFVLLIGCKDNTPSIKRSGEAIENKWYSDETCSQMYVAP
jgi:spermidine synthase